MLRKLFSVLCLEEAPFAAGGGGGGGGKGRGTGHLTRLSKAEAAVVKYPTCTHAVWDTL